MTTPSLYRLLSALLDYPEPELLEALPEIDRLLAATPDTHQAHEKLTPLLDTLRSTDLITLQEHYVATFDRNPSHALHLFEHVHGDSRDRGPAMIDLTQTYEKAGLFLGPDEMPDYLPVVLEFVSTQPPKEARAFLGEMAHIFNAIFNALQQRKSPYASVLGALLELSGEKAHPVKIVADEPLDTTWEEPVVFDGCSVKGQTKPDQPQPIHFVKTDAVKARQSAAAIAGVPL